MTIFHELVFEMKGKFTQMYIRSSFTRLHEQNIKKIENSICPYIEIKVSKLFGPQNVSKQTMNFFSFGELSI